MVDLLIHDTFLLCFRFLAMPPGHDFFKLCGDVFSCHVVDNPDIASEVALLRSVGPDVPKDKVLQLSILFAELRDPWRFRKWRFPKIGIHQNQSKSSIFSRIVHYQPSISGYLHLWKPPNIWNIWHGTTHHCRMITKIRSRHCQCKTDASSNGYFDSDR